jgi:hypothetical protein
MPQNRDAVSMASARHSTTSSSSSSSTPRMHSGSSLTLPVELCYQTAVTNWRRQYPHHQTGSAVPSWQLMQGVVVAAPVASPSIGHMLRIACRRFALGVPGNAKAATAAVHGDSAAAAAAAAVHGECAAGEQLWLQCIRCCSSSELRVGRDGYARCTSHVF